MWRQNDGKSDKSKAQHSLWREISQSPGSGECCNCSLQRAPALPGHNGMTFLWLQTSISSEPQWSKPRPSPLPCHPNYVIQVFLQHRHFLICFKGGSNLCYFNGNKSGFCFCFCSAPCCSCCVLAPGAGEQHCPGHRDGYPPSGSSLREWQLSTRLSDFLICCGGPCVTWWSTGSAISMHNCSIWCVNVCCCV